MYSGQTITQNFPTAPRNSTYDPAFVTGSVASYQFPNRTQTTAGVQYADSSQYAAGNTCSTGYPYSPNTSTYTNSYNSVVTNYAASALYNQHAAIGQSDTSTAIYSSGKASTWNFKKAMRGNKVKTAQKVQQLHYCEVCKISCAGPQTYKEHLEGQRHKKKEAQLKPGNSSNTVKRGHNTGVSLRCELCDVTCTGNDAYAAHIRGSKHQKVVKLHTKLGKPIPSTDPVLINAKGGANKGQNNSLIPQIPAAAGKIKVLGTPRINFIGGGRLHTTAGIAEKEDKLVEDISIPQNSVQQVMQTTPCSSTNALLPVPELSQSAIEIDKDCQPVGQDYVEEVRNDDGKTISFHCKLCDCRFNDPNAKEMHLKGRRHRLQYKKKVDPNLVVDIKPSLKHRKIQELKDRRYFHKQRDQHYWSDWYPQGTRYGYDLRHIPPPPPPHMHAPASTFGSVGGAIVGHYRRGPLPSGSWDDNHIMQKHSEIIPKEEELDEILHIVQVTERALKAVSDKLAEDDSQAAMNEVIKKELGDDLPLSSNSKDTTNAEDKSPTANNPQCLDTEKHEEAQANRILKGLMRIGPLAKNLLLSGDRDVGLVVICAEKPTKQLLQRVVDNLPKQLQAISTAETFEIVMKPQEAGLTVSSTTEPRITINVYLTSPLVRETNITEGAPAEMVKEPKQMLERHKCLEALAALRHAKWYQARVSNLHPCPVVIRLLRDLCRRLPTWAKLDLWAVELLCERVISSAGEQLSPGEAFRHVLESLASGLLLPGGAGLFDPCEKDPSDALSALTRQEREDITSSAQHALRLIAFRQIHKILGVEPIAQKTRKRRSDSEVEENADQETDGLKKVKKEVANFAEDEGITSTDGQQFTSETTETNA
ncbi:zinc finger RNA-binding protein-like protein [Leptotrombidium deliense]|uniref:Zinc finger RNA-binding protein n=1 Tax=Leptotrombidium deliense TaxID=299467 RepID=A0A443SJY0_9ACAR|nr:zinc finger RNA-binding protein-like protein [Leptotrombidium deliense]